MSSLLRDKQITDVRPLENLQAQPVVGVVGGGQLAQMLVGAADKRSVQTIVQTSSRKDPAAIAAKNIVLATPQDVSGTKKLLESCSCVTFENEWVNIENLSLIKNHESFFLPPLSALEPLVDKISQRQLLDSLGIPGPAWIQLSSQQVGSSKIPTGWDFPLMAKMSRGGYDGKGTRVLKNFDDLKKLIESVETEDWLLETWVPYECELALVASRDREGRVKALPLVETHQSDQVCDWVLAPAEVNHAVEAMAYNVVASLLTELNYVGVIAVEFFFGTKGLLVNEVAPRTHNSAHFSIEACNTSQFDQQICIAAGIPIPEPKLLVPGALMVNLLGLTKEFPVQINDRLTKLREIPGATVHWYNKNQELLGRKMGHVTFLLNTCSAASRRDEALKALKAIRDIWPMNLSK